MAGMSLLKCIEVGHQCAGVGGKVVAAGAQVKLKESVVLVFSDTHTP